MPCYISKDQTSQMLLTSKKQQMQGCKQPFSMKVSR